eukprot:Pgem_evm1s12633
MLYSTRSLISFLLTTTVCSGCQLIPLDYSFVLDASGSVGKGNFTLEKNFTSNIIKSMQTDEYVSITTFSNSVKESYPFTKSGDFAPAYSLDNVVYEKKCTRTANALDALLQNIQQNDPTDRSNVAFLVTDGVPVSCNGGNQNVCGSNAVAPYKTLFTDANVTLVIIAVGNFQDQLIDCITEVEPVHIKDFSDLTKLNLTDLVCECSGNNDKIPPAFDCPDSSIDIPLDSCSQSFTFPFTNLADNCDEEKDIKLTGEKITLDVTMADTVVEHTVSATDTKGNKKTCNIKLNVKSIPNTPTPEVCYCSEISIDQKSLSVDHKTGYASFTI